MGLYGLSSVCSTGYVDSILEFKIKFYSSKKNSLLVSNVGTLYISSVQQIWSNKCECLHFREVGYKALEMEEI